MVTCKCYSSPASLSGFVTIFLVLGCFYEKIKNPEKNPTSHLHLIIISAKMTIIMKDAHTSLVRGFLDGEWSVNADFKKYFYRKNFFLKSELPDLTLVRWFLLVKNYPTSTNRFFWRLNRICRNEDEKNKKSFEKKRVLHFA